MVKPEGLQVPILNGCLLEQKKPVASPVALDTLGHSRLAGLLQMLTQEL